MALPLQEVKSEREDDLEEGEGLVRRYVPLRCLYSATPRCVMSKKVKARKMLMLDDDDVVDHHQHHLPGPNRNQPSLLSSPNKPPLTHFYSRRCRKRARKTPNPSPVFDSYVSKLSCAKTAELPVGAAAVVVKVEEIEVVEEEESSRVLTKKRKRRSTELTNLGVDDNALIRADGPPSRELRSSSNPRRCTRQSRSAALVPNNNGARNKVSNNSSATRSSRFKKWVRLKFDGIDPKKFVGLQCKVYWPLDADWYSGSVVEYDSESGQHHVEYEDGEVETLTLSNERVKFYISPEETRTLRLSYAVQHSDADDLDTNEMVVLAASLDDSHDIETGDIIWAKLTGHAVWPAIVLDESLVSVRKGLSKMSGENSFLVQFFGTHDFARVKMKQVISFLKGLLSSYHLKCKKPDFIRSMEEAKMYLSKQKLPKRMLNLRDGVGAACESESEEDEGCGGSSNKSSGDEGVQRELQCLPGCPLKIGDLEVLRLGKILKNVDGSEDDKFLWPLGYRAVRKFVSLTDPSVHTLYKMEVLRDDDSKTRPLFRVTTDDGEQFNGSSPSACWNKVYKRLRKMQFGGTDYLKVECASARTFRSGSDMFGFSEPEVLKLIQETSDLKLPSKFSGLICGRCEEMPVNYRPVHVDWKDLDKCNVCHMDEEYANNLFLQCDKCRMMVHARCYGELEPADGVLWLCNLCRPGAPELTPPCCLCPVIGGAMKPTTDGRWAHLACAMWIPETCLSDIKRMEPIDGLSRVSKDRWKLLCSICGVSYGACIQCSNRTCYVAYHPLCARAAGFCAELADLDRLHMIPIDEDEDNQCIRLVSFCKKHSPIPSNGCSIADERIGRMPNQYADTPPINPSGCARCEPYNHLGRRGRKEPEVLAAASLKRAFVENRPYLVSGHSQHQSLGLEKLKHLQHDASRNIVSMAEKYKYMRRTFRKRLAFGKSGIHGFGIFAKFPHKAGDMVIEYTGELVRPPIADRREHQIYNSLVGAGTYMFRIDDERVIDATRAGSIAHLINHSCEPNCYSRVISVNGDEHIIIFAKRDIKRWEELTYDYRFFSIDEQLSCYCGFPSCRGVVNDVETEAQVSKQFVPRSELSDWTGQ